MSQSDPSSSKEQKARNIADEYHLRAQYNSISKKLTDADNEIGNPQKQELSDLVSKVDLLGCKVRNPREAAVDAEIFQRLAHQGYLQAQKLFEGQGMSLETFLQSIKQRYCHSGMIQNEERRIDWTKVGNIVTKNIHQTPKMITIYGPLQKTPIQVKKQNRKVRAVQKRASTFLNPNSVKSSAELHDRELREATERIKIQNEVITKIDKEDMLKFVTNPKSFSQSVENLMDLAFLVRDGHAKVNIDPVKKFPVIGVGERVKGAVQTTNQCIVRFDYQTFQKLIDEGIQEPSIPDRTTK